MATHDVQVRVNLRKNSNAKSPEYNHLYPYIERTGTIDTRGFCKHIAGHNTIYGREVVEGVVALFSNCLFELLSIGVAVKLDSIGTFYPTLTSRKGGATSLEEARMVGADDLVTGIHVRFLPDSTKLDDTTSKKFKERCSLKLNMLQTITKKTVGDKKKYIYSYTPIYQDEETQPEP